MKKALFIGIGFLILSCSVQTKNQPSEAIIPIVKESKITKTENDIITDFFGIELKKDRYKPYKDYPICIIKEDIGRLSSLKIYEYCYNDRDLPIKSSTNKDWILNEVQIKKIKDTYNNNERHDWEVSDFTTLNVSILESSELIKSIKESTYIKLPKRLIIYLSTPLIIDTNNAFISFDCGSSSSGFKTIERFTALMKKNKNGKWEIDSYYYNPNSTW